MKEPFSPIAKLGLGLMTASVILGDIIVIIDSLI